MTRTGKRGVAHQPGHGMAVYAEEHAGKACREGASLKVGHSTGQVRDLKNT